MEHEHLSPTTQLQSTMQFLFQWKQAQKSLHPSCKATPSQLRWHNPPSGSLKCNFDASFTSSSSPSVFGAIIRDERGVFQHALHGPLSITLDPTLVEALACRETLLWL